MESKSPYPRISPTSRRDADDAATAGRRSKTVAAMPSGGLPAAAVEPEIRRYTAADGYRVHYRYWRPCGGTPVGYVVALHGIQSHSGWYTYSSRRLCRAGYEVSFLDRRGSGMNTDGPRGDAPDHGRLIGDVAGVLSEVGRRRNREAPGAPIILLGTSWGGKLAAVACAEHPELVDALALLYPGICARVRLSWFQRVQLRTAEWLGIRRPTVAIPLRDPGLFTDEAVWQEFIRNDPLALHELTVSFLLANRELDRLALETPPKLICPVLCMLAGGDQIIDNPGTRRYFEQIASKQRTLLEYPQARHTLEFEPDRDQIFSDLLAWFDACRHGREPFERNDELHRAA